MSALSTDEPLAPEPALNAVPFERTLTSDDLLAYLRDRLPTAAVRSLIVPITSRDRFHERER